MTAHIVPWSHRPLGRLLLDGEFLHGRALADALDTHRSSGERLGQVLLSLGHLSDAELSALLAIQPHTTKLEDALKLAAGSRQKIGDLLLAARRITPEQLNEALAAQASTGERLGEILVEKKLLRAEELDALLSFQRQQENPASSVKHMQLGELLVSLGEITRQQLEQALARQAVTGRKLGELLIEAGHLLRDGLNKALKLQAKLLAAVLIAVLALSAVSFPAGAADGYPPSSPKHVTQTMSVTVQVLEVMRLNVLHQTHTVTVKAEDIARGYVEVAAGTNVEILCNAPAGFRLDFRLQDSPFPQAEVRGLNKNVVVGPAGASITSVANFQYQQLRTAHEFSYRFIVPATMSAGVYPFPLQISISNL